MQYFLSDFDLFTTFKDLSPPAWVSFNGFNDRCAVGLQQVGAGGQIKDSHGLQKLGCKLNCAAACVALPDCRS